MGAFKKYLASDIIEADDIPGYKIERPKVCQGCINKKTSLTSIYGDTSELCGVYNVGVNPYGTCQKWKERRG